jgi:hypothetical protein
MPSFSDFPKIRWSVKDKLDREALEGILGSFRWLVFYGVFSLTSSTFIPVETYFHAQPY